MSFDVTLCQKYVESLLRHDELDRALMVLDNVPAFYRLHPPPELMRLRAEILKHSVTPLTYAKSTGDDFDYPEDKCAKLFGGYVRGQALIHYVKTLNNQGLKPHIVDYGPGPYLAPRTLKHLGLEFTYWDLAINEQAKSKFRPMIVDYLKEDGFKCGFSIFLGLEVIEHLHNPIDLAVEAVKNCGGRYPEVVMLSTPFCTFDVIPESEDWRRADGLQHLRAYTPEEFIRAASHIFPGYDWELTNIAPKVLHPMSLVGARSGVFKKPDAVD